MYVLKKETKRRSYSLGTGGGSPIKIFFSPPLEEELLNFITPEAAGMENIPQGGIYLCENITDPCDAQEKQNFKENEKELPHKKFCTNNQFLETSTGIDL